MVVCRRDDRSTRSERSRELTDDLIVNPYLSEETTGALHSMVTMSEAGQREHIANPRMTSACGVDLLRCRLQDSAQTLTLKLSAYLAGSLPSHTTPSISLLVRIGSFGILIFKAEAACLYRST